MYVCVHDIPVRVYVRIFSCIPYTFNIHVGKTAHFKQLQKEVQDCNAQIGQLSLKLSKQDDVIILLQEDLKMLLMELSSTKVTLNSLKDILQTL